MVQETVPRMFTRRTDNPWETALSLPGLCFTFCFNDFFGKFIIKCFIKVKPIQIRFKRLNEYLTKDGRKEQYNENPFSEWDRKRDYGILSHKPLQSVAPFTIFERAPKDNAAEQRVKVNYTVVGIIEVTVFLIKSMIVLDSQEAKQLKDGFNLNFILYSFKL